MEITNQQSFIEEAPRPEGNIENLIYDGKPVTVPGTREVARVFVDCLAIARTSEVPEEYTCIDAASECRKTELIGLLSKSINGQISVWRGRVVHGPVSEIYNKGKFYDKTGIKKDFVNTDNIT